MTYLQSVENETVIEIIEEGRQGERGSDGAGLPVGGLIGQVPTKQSEDDFDIIWTDVNIEGENNKTVRGGETPDDYLLTVSYVVGNRVSYLDKEYLCLVNNLGVFTPTDWREVSTQANEARITTIEGLELIIEQLTVDVIAGQPITTSINLGANALDFENNNNLLISFNSLEQLKGIDVMWLTSSTFSIKYDSVTNEDYTKLILNP